jgi:hypothetical protein
MARLSSDENRLNEAEQARRDFMKAAGKLAIYTPPALMLLMRPSREAVAASAGIPQTSQESGNEEGYQKDHHGRFWLWRLLTFWE